MENPLGRVVAKGFGQAVGIALGRDFLPALQVEGDFDQRSIRDFECLVDLAHFFIVFRRGAKAPDGGEMGRIIWNYSRCIIIIKFATI